MSSSSGTPPLEDELKARVLIAAVVARHWARADLGPHERPLARRHALACVRAALAGEQHDIGVADGRDRRLIARIATRYGGDRGVA